VLRSIAAGARSLKDKPYGRLAVAPAESELVPALIGMFVQWYGASPWYY